MKNAPSLENTPRVLAVAVAFFGGLAFLAHALGIFERFDRIELAALALFALGFAALTAAVDPGVRALLGRFLVRRAPAAKASDRRPAVT